MTLLNRAGVARPVRMAAKSSLATSTAFSIFSSASRRVSSITVAPSSRRRRRRPSWTARRAPSTGCHERADPLTPDRARHVPLTLHPEHDHGQLVVHAQAEGRRVDDLQALAQRLAVGDLLELAGAGVSAGVGRVDAVDAVLA